MTKCISSVSAVLKHLYNGDHSNFPIESLKDLLFGVSKESVLEQLKNDDWDTPENINTINNWYKAVNKFD